MVRGESDDSGDPDPSVVGRTKCGPTRLKSR